MNLLQLINVDNIKIQKSHSLKDLSKITFLKGFLLGIAVSLLFYFFQQYLFILFRYVVLSIKYNPNFILDKSIGNLLVLVFSANSVLIGNNVFLSYLATKFSRNNISKRNSIRRIFNDQYFLSGSYFYWYVKVSSLLMGLTEILGDKELLKMIYPIYLLIFVKLFFDQIKSLRRVLNDYGWKQIINHLLTIILCFFCIGQINRSKYNTLEKGLNMARPFVALPEIKLNDTLKLQYINPHRCNIKVKVLAGIENDKAKFRLGDMYVSARDVAYSVLESCDYDYYGLTAYVNRNVKMEDVLELEYQLKKLNFRTILFAYKDESNRIDNLYYNVIKKVLYVPESIVYSEDFILANSPPLNYDKLNTNLKKSLVVNINLHDFDLDSKSAVKYFKSQIDSNTYFNFQFKGDLAFEEYSAVYAYYNQAVYELRKENETLLEYPIHYFKLSNEEKRNYHLKWKEEQKKLKQIFRFNYLENYDGIRY